MKASKYYYFSNDDRSFVANIESYSSSINEFQVERLDVTISLRFFIFCGNELCYTKRMESIKVEDAEVDIFAESGRLKNNPDYSFLQKYILDGTFLNGVLKTTPYGSMREDMPEVFL